MLFRSKLRIAGRPHELSRLADHRLVELLGEFGVLPFGEPTGKTAIMSRHEYDCWRYRKHDEGARIEPSALMNPRQDVSLS